MAFYADDEVATSNLRKSLQRGSESEKYPILFHADLREIANAGRRWIGNKSEAVTVRERRHHRNRRRSRYCDRGCILNEVATHLVYGLICSFPLDDPAPFHIKRVDDPLHLIDCPIDALNTVGNRERIINTQVPHVKRRGSGVQIHVSATWRDLCAPEYVRRRQPCIPRMRTQRAR